MIDPLLSVIILVIIILIELLISVLLSKNKTQRLAVSVAFGSLAALGILFYYIVIVLSKNELFPIFVVACLLIPIGLYLLLSRTSSARAVATAQESAAGALKPGLPGRRPKAGATPRPEVQGGKTAATAATTAASLNRVPVTTSRVDSKLPTSESPAVSTSPAAASASAAAISASAAATASSGATAPSSPAYATTTLEQLDTSTSRPASLDQKATAWEVDRPSSAAASQPVTQAFAPASPAAYTTAEIPRAIPEQPVEQQRLRPAAPEAKAADVQLPVDELPSAAATSPAEPDKKPATKKSFEDYFSKAENLKQKGLYTVSARLFEQSVYATSDMEQMHKALFASISAYQKAGLKQDVRRLALILQESKTMSRLQEKKLAAILKML